MFICAGCVNIVCGAQTNASDHSITSGEGGAGEVAQLVKCLPCKQDYPRLNPQHPHEKLGIASYGYHPSLWLGEAKTGRSLKVVVQQAQLNWRASLSMRDLPQKIRVKNS